MLESALLIYYNSLESLIICNLWRRNIFLTSMNMFLSAFFRIHMRDERHLQRYQLFWKSLGSTKIKFCWYTFPWCFFPCTFYITDVHTFVSSCICTCETYIFSVYWSYWSYSVDWQEEERTFIFHIELLQNRTINY